MGILSFFRKPELTEPPVEPIDTSHLEESFQLLQNTVTDVAQAAAEAAKALQKKKRPKKHKYK